MDGTPHPFAAWLALPTGFRFPDVPVTVEKARQRRDHDMVGVEDGLFGDRVNVGALTDVITQAVHAARLPIDGRVLLAIEVEQLRPVRMGQPLVSRGGISSLSEAPLGHRLDCSFDILPLEGVSPAAPLARVRSEFLLMSKAPDRPAGRGSAKATADELRAGYRLVGHTTLTPRKVCDYCADLGNLIHLDLAYAQARGYRAPVAPRLLDVTMMVGALPALWGPAIVDSTFGLRLRVLRPVFWDDELKLWAKPMPEKIAFRCFSGDGRMVTEAEAWR